MNDARIRLFGELTLSLDGAPSAALPASRRTRALLAFLAVSARPHTRTRLCELFWSGPSDPRGALRWSLSKLRPLVPLVTDGEHVALGPGVTTDIARVGSALSEATSKTTEALEQALAEVRGEPFEDLDLHDCFAYQEWLSAERESLRRLTLAALGTLSERVRESSPERALAYARRSVSLDPLNEAVHVDVMGLLSRLGRSREAFAHYERCRRMLASELGKQSWPRLERARSELTSRASAPASVTPPAVREPASAAAERRQDFIGRVEERQALSEALRAGSPVILLLGEPGLGKSRLLEVASEHARKLGGLALYGRAFEAEMVRPYGPWIDALRALPLSTLAPSLRGHLAPLLPELNENNNVETDRARMFDAIVAFLTELSGTRSLSIALDDVQWLDDASASLVHYVARRGTCPLWLAARPGELHDNAAVRGMLRTLRREGRLSELTLSALTRDETRALLAHASVDVGRVYERSAGNPLYALELTKALQQGVSPDAVPETLQGLLQEQLSTLGEQAKTLVTWAAALGHSFGLDLLAQVAASAPSDLLRGIEELERRGIFRSAAAGQSQFGYDFAHDLLRRAAYLAMSAPRRALCHARVAEVLRALPDPDAVLAGDLIHHAALSGQDELAARAAVRFGERCLSLFAHAEALETAERGLYHAARLASAARVALSIDLLRVMVLAAKPSRHDELERALSAAVTEASRLGEVSAVAAGSRTLAVLRYTRGDLPGAGESSDAAARAYRRSQASREVAGEIAHSARCLLYVGRVQEGRGLFDEARALAQRIEARHIELPFAEACFCAFDGDLARARALFHDTLLLARESHDHWRECECLLRLGMLELEAGDDAAASTRASELRALAARMEADGADLRAAEVLGLLAELRARDDEVRAALHAALARLIGVDNKSLVAYAFSLLAEADLSAGRSDLAAQHARKALEMAQTVRSTSDSVIGLALLVRALRAQAAQPNAAELASALAELARFGASSEPLSGRASSALASLREEPS
jgi:DNA-binding SARP family transcriptional activator